MEACIISYAKVTDHLVAKTCYLKSKDAVLNVTTYLSLILDNNRYLTQTEIRTCITHNKFTTTM